MIDNEIIVDNNYEITISDFEKIVNKQKKLKLSDREEFIKIIDSGHASIKEKVKAQLPMYGVTTGFGDSCKYKIPYELTKKLQENIVKYHGCGLGKHHSEKESMGITLLRLISNSKGYSGVTYKLLKQMEQFINLEITPLIPELGSVGASGDLTPLSYLAATLTGKRRVSHKNKEMTASEALRMNNMMPISLEPKEGLAIMNGTSVMTSVAALCIIESKKIAFLVELTTSMTIEVLKGNKGPFEPIIHRNKPFKGQIKTAENILKYLSTSKRAKSYQSVVKNIATNKTDDFIYTSNIQDKYSLRCSPHIIGILRDVVEWSENIVQIEMNSVTDNPMIDYETGSIHSGGNFYGGYICTAMDTLRATLADIADLLDKQLSLLVDEKFNKGLPPNLAYIKKDEPFIKHGFKAVQITSTALTAEIISLAQPIRVLSRPTEALNQDKVSLGNISARYTRNCIDLLKYVISIKLMCLTQAMDIIGVEEFSDVAKKMYETIRNEISFVNEDRELDVDINKVYNLINTLKSH